MTEEKAEKTENEDTATTVTTEPTKKLKTWCLPDVKEWTLPPEVLFLFGCVNMEVLANGGLCQGNRVDVGEGQSTFMVFQNR